VSPIEYLLPREFETELAYLVDVGYLARAGEEAFRITVAGINEVQRRPVF
jgi:hypothetical protein